tara:strand:+ start:1192 stop:1851 length:660 start_codon:yes stop_codon:yes gene_type:complete
MDAMPLKKGDRAERLVEEIRQAIISGALKPGAALRQEELAKTYQSSRMPIREALRTLSAEGLVQLSPNKGGIVAPVDVTELRENVEMREAAEVLAMRVALPHLSNAQIDEAATIQEELARSGLEDFGRLNKAFHLALYAPANRPRLLAHISSLHDIAERYLRLTLVEFDYIFRSSEEHGGILEACYRRDTEAAIAATSRHILDAGETLLAFLEKGGKTR